MPRQPVLISIQAVGPPGSGKTTAITLMTEALKQRFDFNDSEVGHFFNGDHKNLVLTMKDKP